MLPTLALTMDQVTMCNVQALVKRVGDGVRVTSLIVIGQWAQSLEHMQHTIMHKPAHKGG